MSDPNTTDFFVLLEQFIEQKIEFGEFSPDLITSEKMFAEVGNAFADCADALAIFADRLALRGGEFIEEVQTGESVWRGARLKA